MKLDAWLKQDQPLEDRLRVIERLCQAINEVHDRGEVVGGLEPSRIALGAEGQCDLSGARKRTPRPPYAPPEGDRLATALADIHAAGAISWEILAGRPAGASPAHLAQVRPDLQRELADAVMACLEESPDWRPSDLTFLAQMAAARQSVVAGGPVRASRPPVSPRAARPPRRRSPSRRTWPLLVALIVVLGLAALAGRPYLGDLAGFLPTGTPTPGPLAQAPLAAAPTPPAQATPDPTPAAGRQGPARGPGATGTGAPSVEPGSATGATTVGVSTNDTTERADLRAPGEETASTPEPFAPPAPRESAVGGPPAGSQDPLPPPDPAVAPVTRAPAPAPAEPAPTAADVEPTPAVQPRPPAVLSAVAPPTVKRPGKVLLDLRGTGLGARHQAVVLPVRKVPRGIKVVRQKHVNDTLITVLLELDDSAEPGEYAIAVEDGQGGRSESLVFEVTK